MAYVNIIQIIILILLGLATLYIFIFSVASLFYKQKQYPNTGKINKMAVLIPGYKEDAVIVDVAKSTLQQKLSTIAFRCCRYRRFF